MIYFSFLLGRFAFYGPDLEGWVYLKTNKGIIFSESFSELTINYGVYHKVNSPFLYKLYGRKKT